MRVNNFAPCAWFRWNFVRACTILVRAFNALVHFGRQTAMISRSPATRPSVTSSRGHVRTAINLDLSWLHKMRWAALAGQLLTIVVVHGWMHIELPLAKMLAVIGGAAATNVALGAWLRRNSSHWPAWAGQGEWVSGSLMMLDNLLLTVLLYYSGGPSNPFTVFYLVNIALAAAVLPARWAWALDAAAFSCFALLFAVHVSLEALEHGPAHEHALHHGTRTAPGPMSLHLQGSLVAFGLAATFIVYLITHITGELAKREAELQQARERQAHSEKLDALVTLATGAAHELASPLSTIAVLARDLELSLATQTVDASAASDMRLIRVEVDRCRKILDSMASRSGKDVGEAIISVGIDDLLAAVAAELADRDRIDWVLLPELVGRRASLPKIAVCQALRAIVQNALQASPDGERVVVTASRAEGDLQLVVADRGAGMSDEVLRRAGEPFFTTKDPGSGMGLGLFFARRVIERLGGYLVIESKPMLGTSVTIRLPIAVTAPESSRVARDPAVAGTA